MVRRTPFANGSEKPTPRTFQDKLSTLKEASRGLDPESTLRLFDFYIQEALTKGELTEQQASGIYQSLPQAEIKETIENFERENFVDGGEVNLKDLTLKKRQSNIDKWISNNSQEAYDNASQASKRKIQLGENVVLDKKIQYADTTKGKLRTYLSELPDGSTINRKTLAEKFGIKKASMGNVTEVLNDFKFINPVKGIKKEPKIKLTSDQKKLPMLLFGKKENELTTDQRSLITSGRYNENTMTPYRRSKMYDPFSLKEYGKTWNELSESQKNRVRAGKGPEVLPPGNKVKVENELRTLSKNKKLMEMFKKTNRTKSDLMKDITLVKKILGPETNAIARITQLAAAVSGDKPVDGIPTTYKKNASFIYNNLPHTKTQRELDELIIGKSVNEKSIKTTKGKITKNPNYIFTGDYNIDEPAGVTSSVRNRSTPYGIFGQVIQTEINKKDKKSFDGNKSKKEKALQEAIADAKKRNVNIKTDKKVLAALKDFNKLVSEYETKINANVPKGGLKVELFKASLDSPNNTIKNFGTFNSDYKKAFLNNYKNLGYSFVVPKNINTIPQIVEKINDPTESIVRALTPEEEGGFSETEKLARKKLNILKTVKPSDITTIASLAAQDPEYEGAPAKYLDFLKSQNLESIVEPAEKEFQEKVMIPFRETKKTQREPVISGLNELINQFSTKKYDSEEIL